MVDRMSPTFAKRVVVIPAVKKNVAFPDDLVKRLAGETLLHRCLRLAKQIETDKKLRVLTDSLEIELECKREGIPVRVDPTFNLADLSSVEVRNLLRGDFIGPCEEILILWPYTPQLSAQTIDAATQRFRLESCDLLLSLQQDARPSFQAADHDLTSLVHLSPTNRQVESRGFSILRSEALSSTDPLKTIGHELPEEVLEIRSYRDWWVCEKLIKRKRIAFRVIGSHQIGMGHVYRSLALAREITDHEIVFFCEEKDQLAVNGIAGADYLVETCSDAEAVEERLLDYRPHLLVNDVLDTSGTYVQKMRTNGSCVVNFEDLGPGSLHANLVINELYEKPCGHAALPEANAVWGNEYLFLREEFTRATPHETPEQIHDVLVTFGGADPSNYTGLAIRALLPEIETKDARVHVVLGKGYLYGNTLRNTYEGHPNVRFHNGSATMSELMETCQLAICSNGRTPYELAHMRVPAIVLSQNDREEAHSFASRESGFVRLGILRGEGALPTLRKELCALIHSPQLFAEKHAAQARFNFSQNRAKVARLVLKVIPKNE